MNPNEILRLDAQGWCVGVSHMPSPHVDARPSADLPQLLVIHNISLPPGEFGGPEIAALFCGTLDTSSHPALADLAGVRVSAHFLIRRDASIIQFVSCLQRAWHAGVSEFNGRSRCNDFSIGIELEGCDTCAFVDEQYVALRQLTQALCLAYPLSAVRGHQHIAPGRKTDPGPCFDWQKYQDQGFAQLTFPD